MATFFSYNALVSQRASGYKSTMHALAELIDNSFDAEAKKVRIILLESTRGGRRHIEEVLICDDGTGMTEEVLQGALQFGNTTNTEMEEMVRLSKKGKFGYGLPNASLSQCPAIHVYSWKSSSQIISTYLDIDELGQTKSIEIPKVQTVPFPANYNSVDAVLNNSHGTIVSWRRCDRLSNVRSSTIVEKSEKLLGRLFRYLLLQGKVIEFTQFLYNSTHARYEAAAPVVSVRINDPLFLMSNTVISKDIWREAMEPVADDVPDNRNTPKHYKAFAGNSPNECSPTNVKIVDHSYKYPFLWKGKEIEFEIIASVADIKIQKPGVREGGATSVGQFYGEKQREGNISFVRAEREISSGNFGFYRDTEPRNRWWSIEVKFSPNADDLLGVHNNKQGIEFTATPNIDIENEWDQYSAELLQAREKLWNELTIKINTAYKSAWEIVRRQHREWDNANVSTGTGGPGDGGKTLPSGTRTTSKVIGTTDGRRATQFTESQKSQLMERLCQRYPQIQQEDIKRAIDNYDQLRVRGCVLYAELESDQLWSFATVYDFLVITINSKHEFYVNVLHPLKMAGYEEALAAMELFISSLAWEQHNHFQGDSERDVLDQFRSYVGLHLNRYMRHLKVTEESLSGEEADDGDDEQE